MRPWQRFRISLWPRVRPLPLSKELELTCERRFELACCEFRMEPIATVIPIPIVANSMVYREYCWKRWDNRPLPNIVCDDSVLRNEHFD